MVEVLSLLGRRSTTVKKSMWLGWRMKSPYQRCTIFSPGSDSKEAPLTAALLHPSLTVCFDTTVAVERKQ